MNRKNVLALFRLGFDYVPRTVALCFLIGIKDKDGSQFGAEVELSQGFYCVVLTKTVNSGKREEGSYSGIYKIFTAFSYFFQTVIFAIVAIFTGYNPILATGNTDAAKFGLLFQMSIIPMIITIIGTIAFVFLYKISKEEAIGIKLKIEEMNL